MALGKRQPRQQNLWIAAPDLRTSPGHPFYQRLHALLDEAGFDRFVEAACQPHDADGVGYFEGLDSQRGIAWRCADSRSLQAFLGLLPTEATPDHSSLTRVRQRLPQAVHDQVFGFVLQIANDHGLLAGKTPAVDSTTLEANAAMKAMNDMTKHAAFWLAEGDVSPGQIGSRLKDIPMSALKHDRSTHGFPRDAFKAMVDNVGS